jgi:hypothetical protein
VETSAATVERSPSATMKSPSASVPATTSLGKNGPWRQCQCDARNDNAKDSKQGGFFHFSTSDRALAASPGATSPLPACTGIPFQLDLPTLYTHRLFAAWRYE